MGLKGEWNELLLKAKDLGLKAQVCGAMQLVGSDWILE